MQRALRKTHPKVLAAFAQTSRERFARNLSRFLNRPVSRKDPNYAPCSTKRMENDVLCSVSRLQVRFEGQGMSFSWWKERRFELEATPIAVPYSKHEQTEQI